MFVWVLTKDFLYICAHCLSNCCSFESCCSLESLKLECSKLTSIFLQVCIRSHLCYDFFVSILCVSCLDSWSILDICLKIITFYSSNCERMRIRHTCQQWHKKKKNASISLFAKIYKYLNIQTS